MSIRAGPFWSDMHSRYSGAKAAFALLLWVAATLPSLASPWAEVGDNQLRADIELLQATGIVDDVTTQWPLPWQSLLLDLSRADVTAQSAGVQAAAGRVLAQAQMATTPGVAAWASLDATNKPGLVYGFNGMGRGEGQAQLSLEGTSGAFAGRISLGGITQNFGGKSNKIMADGTYFSARLGGVRLYAGYLDHWWGPGQISALQLSNNARPMPQVGIERSSTAASRWPVLRWLGPWQFEFFLSKLDGPQIQSNVYYDAAHLTINPLPGLEIGLAKTEEFCGQGHPCSPLRDYFTNFDLSNHPDNVNGEGSLEVKYAHTLGGVPFQVYMQLMNEDYSWFSRSGTSHLFGSSFFLPTAGSPVKLTVEYTDSIATKTLFSFGDNVYGFSYTNGQYPDGMRYRGRTLGFSLDDDSTLLSLQGSWSDAAGRFYELAVHHATIGSSHSAGANIVSATPVMVNMGEARVSLPLNGGTFRLDLAGRLQDDQPRPHSGFAAAVEVALRAPL
ncbi:MAG TPA: capsule assembly Wzi family protein [Rhizomicrobium sp.]|nr:capsule assembly Wzi family protein [Rhizomicrobium sp.]